VVMWSENGYLLTMGSRFHLVWSRVIISHHASS